MRDTASRALDLSRFGAAPAHSRHSFKSSTTVTSGAWEWLGPTRDAPHADELYDGLLHCFSFRWKQAVFLLHRSQAHYEAVVRPASLDRAATYAEIYRSNCTEAKPGARRCKRRCSRHCSPSADHRPCRAVAAAPAPVPATLTTCGEWEAAHVSNQYRSGARQSLCSVNKTGRGKFAHFEFMPASPTAATWPRADSEAFLDKVRRVQSGAGGACGFLVGAPPSINGLGHLVGSLAAQLTDASARGVPLSFVEGRGQGAPFTRSAFCRDSVGATCFFREPTPCARRNLRNGFGWKGTNDWPDIKMVSLPRDERFARYGHVWAIAHAVGFMWELQPRLRAAVDALLAQWRRDRPGGTRRGDGLTVGMHYRCGDSNFGDSPERWERFIRAAKEMQARYGAARIFLATDSPPAAARCARMTGSLLCETMAHTQVRAVLDEQLVSPKVTGKAGREIGYNFIEARVRRGDLATDDVGRIIAASFADWEALAECDVFVGDLRSTFFRVALYLTIWRRGRIPPILSFTAGGFAPTIRYPKQDVNA